MPCLCSACNGRVVPHATYYFHQKLLGGDSDSSSDGTMSSDSESEASELDWGVDDDDARDNIDYHERHKRFAREVIELIANKECNESGAARLLSLVNEYYGDDLPKNLRVPYTVHQLTKFAGKPKTTTQLLDVCARGDCHVYDTHDSRTHCPECAHIRRTKDPRQIMLTDMPGRLARMMEVPEIARALRYPLEREPGDGDVWDGKFMARATLGDEENLVLHLGLCSDGYLPFI